MTRARMGSRMGLAAAALVLAASGVGAPLAAQAPAGDSVALVFAWPVGTEARVEYTQITERQGDTPEPSRLEIEGELTLHVHQHPSGGLVIEHLEPLATRVQASPPLAAADPRRVVLSRMGTPTPHTIVSTDGRMLGIDGVPALAAAIRDIVGPETPQPALDALLRELLAERLLVRTARERWNAQVGMWLGTSMKVGEVGAAESEEANPLMPSVVLPYVYEFRLIGMEPCGEGATARTCARLEMFSLPDPVQLEQVMDKALVDMGFPTLSFDGLAQHSQVTLLTDPATLLPFELTMSKLVEGILMDGGQGRVFRRADELTLRYRYTKIGG